MVEHARVESGDRDETPAGERDHEQAGRAEHVPGGIPGVERERGLTTSTTASEEDGPLTSGNDRLKGCGGFLHCSLRSCVFAGHGVAEADGNRTRQGVRRMSR